MRQKKSLFNRTVKFINKIPVTGTYTSAQIYEDVIGVEPMNWWKEWTRNERHRVRVYQTYLKRTGYLEQVEKNIWKVIKQIPDSVTLHDINIALGYVESGLQKTLENESRIVSEYEKRGPRIGEAITIFDVQDPVKACIELHEIGILAVPISQTEIEVHVIHGESGQDLASWMYREGFDIDSFPELEHLIKEYWPEMEGDEYDFEEGYEYEVAVTVLDYTNNKTIIYQGVDPYGVEEFLEERFDLDKIDWMVMGKIRLEIL